MGEVYASSIGGVIESTGVVSLVRESSDEVKADVGQEIELNDTAQTAKGSIQYSGDKLLNNFQHQLNSLYAFPPTTSLFVDRAY